MAAIKTQGHYDAEQAQQINRLPKALKRFRKPDFLAYVKFQ